MPRKKHPKKEVEEALQYAEARNWRVEVGGSHAWGADVLPGQRPSVPMRRVLHHQHLEHAKERRQPREPASASCR
jgi:hypothetical protein